MVLIDEKSSDGLLEVMIIVNCEIKSIIIDDSFLKDKEQFEDYFVFSLNKVIEKVIKINEVEIVVVVKEGMLNILGMDMFK